MISGKAQDAAGAVLLAAAAFTPGLAPLGLAVGELRLRPAGAVSVGLILLLSLPLAGRRRRPVACLAVVGVAFAVYQVLGYPVTIAGLGLFVAIYSAGAHQQRGRRRTIGGALAAYAVMAVALDLQGSTENLLDYVTFAVILAAPWAAGTWVRSRQAQEVRKRELSVGEAISTERARIARELHDVVTHHVTAMVVQTDAAQYLLGPDPVKAAANLEVVSSTGRRALTELRHLLDVLDSAGAGREPAVGRLADLVDTSRALGQPVDWAEEGEPASAGGGVDLAVYRVVQEGLTNAVKHARGRPTKVRVRHRADGTDIEVTTASSTVGAVTPGRGLTGLRERVSVFGGELEAGGTPGGDFTVRAHLPSGAGR